MLREPDPENIPVAPVVIDGAVETHFLRTNLPSVHADRMPGNGILKPGHIAENDGHLHCQPRDAWTFEMDLRPSMETW